MDTNRRKFLKIILIGSGTLLIGKILSPFLSKSLHEPLVKIEEPPEQEKPDFRVVEDHKILTVYDRSGEEIFQIDKGA